MTRFIIDFLKWPFLNMAIINIKATKNTLFYFCLKENLAYIVWLIKTTLLTKLFSQSWILYLGSIVHNYKCFVCFWTDCGSQTCNHNYLSYTMTEKTCFAKKLVHIQNSHFLSRTFRLKIYHNFNTSVP